MKNVKKPPISEMLSNNNFVYERVKEMFGDEEIEVIYKKSTAATEYVEREIAGWGFYQALHQRTYAENGIICDQDVPVKMRDGAIIYIDIYRPEGIDKVPAIVSWGFYGKRPGDIPKTWQVLGVPPKTISKMAKFESPDPGYWVKQGYAVINVDARGTGNSEGKLRPWQKQDAEDGYDLIEWLATQRWCNGKIGTSGNSAVAMAQWYIAAECPPHLTCMAPWEGSNDIYRQFACKGGIPMTGFNEFVFRDIRGTFLVEDHMEMLKEHPLMDAYWEDKIADLSKIRIPCYITGSWSHQLHLTGAINAFRSIRSPKKWLRVHREFEWEDLYTPSSIKDLKEFFDRYLKDINNGWELVPKVRLEVQDAYSFDYDKNRTETDFPIERTTYKKLYLNAANESLSEEPISMESKISYEAENGYACFEYEFKEETELTGYFKLKVWVEADGHDDLDLNVVVLKTDTDGELLPTYVFGNWEYNGTAGCLRASLRELDEKLSTEFQPRYTFKNEQKLKKGEIVPLEIEINPTSKIWHEGEKLVVFLSNWRNIGGIDIYEHDSITKGNHVIHTGKGFDSYIQIPVIPPKYKSKTGNMIYR